MTSVGMGEQDNKRVVGLLGEMSLAVELHLRGWQVYRAYIDEQIDFIAMRLYCRKCKKFSAPEKRAKGRHSFPTNLCESCKTDSLSYVCRFIQVKSSEGVAAGGDDDDRRRFSFHAKLRSNIDARAFYAWIATYQIGKGKEGAHFYIFHHSDINKFDNLNLDSYQKTDNQKTTLTISSDGRVLNRGQKYDYNCFNDEFKDGFDKLEQIFAADGVDS